MKIRKNIGMLLVFMMMITSLFTACGTKKDQGEIGEVKATEGKITAVPDKEPVTITVFEEAKNASDKFGLIAQFEEETGIKVEFNVVPGEGPEKYKKIDISLLSGDTTDVVILDNSNFQSKYANAGLLAPLNELATAANYDMESVYGKYLTKYGSDNEVYYFPADVSMNLVYYNKKIFDDAGVTYPSGSWTWDQYIETAKKLTNKEKGIYGSLMQQWEYYLYIQAQQNKTAAYKADGTSNLDDPAWANSLKWFNDLSAVHDIQPSWIEMSTQQIGWDSFSTGKYGMQYIGSWYTGMFSNMKDYPREWNFGIVQGPGDNILSAGTAYSINANSKHKEEAFLFIKFMAENRYKPEGLLPARVDLTKDDYMTMFENLSAANLEGDATPDEFYKAYVDNGQGAVSEKISGAASAEINGMYVKEAEYYLVGDKSLEETMASIKKKADAAIKEESTLQ